MVKRVKLSYEMARRLYELAAQQGDAIANYSLGCMYNEGCSLFVVWNEQRTTFKLQSWLHVQ